MAVVNTARTRGYALQGDSVKNCALCTAAGAVNLAARGSSVTTGDLAGELDVRDGELAFGDTIDAQAMRISDIVSAKTGRRSEKIGTMAEPVVYSQALDWMNTQPEYTVFAMNVDGPGNWGGEHKCHWLNALKAGGTIRYFDFQSNRKIGANFPTGGQNPASCPVPFTGVITQLSWGSTSQQMHQRDQPGAFDPERAKVVVIAFAP